MKKIIELLERAESAIMVASGVDDPDSLNEAINIINDVMAELKAPSRWETPEQWEQRTGKPWPDDWAVYALYEDNDGKRKWFWGGYEKERDKTGRRNKNPAAIVCATEAGPPPDGWMPE